jgi:hypothetical protein
VSVGNLWLGASKSSPIAEDLGAGPSTPDARGPTLRLLAGWLTRCTTAARVQRCAIASTSSGGRGPNGRAACRLVARPGAARSASSANSADRVLFSADGSPWPQLRPTARRDSDRREQDCGDAVVVWPSPVTRRVRVQSGSPGREHTSSATAPAGAASLGRLGCPRACADRCRRLRPAVKLLCGVFGPGGAGRQLSTRGVAALSYLPRS